MIDLNIDQDNLDINVNIDELDLVKNSESLIAELWLFCAIRQGEIFTDINIGLDQETMLEGSEEEIKNHVSQQLFKYFSNYIVKINYIEVIQVEADRNIKFEIVSIFGIINIEGGV